MRGKIVKRTPTEVVSLANMYVGDKRIHYHLEYPNGGTDPQLPPHDLQTGNCDCIGFALNVKGLDRYQPGIRPFPSTPSILGSSINTDSMIEEATTRLLKQKDGTYVEGGKWFRVLRDPTPGCFIVGHSFRKPLRLKKTIGHIGVVTDVSEYEHRGLAGLQVVHCSSSNANRPGNVNHSAVWKTNGTVWAGYPQRYFIEFNYDYAMGLK